MEVIVREANLVLSRFQSKRPHHDLFFPDWAGYFPKRTFNFLMLINPVPELSQLAKTSSMNSLVRLPFCDEEDVAIVQRASSNQEN
jgi:hypothetical protein